MTASIAGNVVTLPTSAHAPHCSTFRFAGDGGAVLEAVIAVRVIDEGGRSSSRGRGPRGRPLLGWTSLTPTEQAVAGLVATGRTNAEVAGELLMARATAKSHLSQVLRKLGLANRVQLAAALAASTAGGV